MDGSEYHKLRIRVGNDCFKTRVEDAATGKPLPVSRIVIDESVKDGAQCTITFPLTGHIVEGEAIEPPRERRVQVVSREHFRLIVEEIGHDNLLWESKTRERLFYKGMIVVPNDRHDTCSPAANS